MKHMEFIDAVAAADTETLRRKEATYQGSWKRRGGAGAFMMLARKWDRLEGILQRWHPANGGAPAGTMPPGAPYDIFAGVAASPDGLDGSVLAEARDLRQYLTLVEAEMMARGVVHAAALSGSTFSHAARIEHEFYALRAQEWAIETSAARRIIEAELSVYDNGAAREAAARLSTTDALATADTERRASDSGKHSTLTPWVVSTRWRYKHDMQPGGNREALFDIWWEKRAGECWVARPSVDHGQHGCPVELTDVYRRVTGHWIIRPELVPPDAWDYGLPRMRRELNATELGALPAWQRVLYEWIEPETKYRIMNAAWCAD